MLFFSLPMCSMLFFNLPTSSSSPQFLIFDDGSLFAGSPSTLLIVRSANHCALLTTDPQFESDSYLYLSFSTPSPRGPTSDLRERSQYSYKMMATLAFLASHLITFNQTPSLTCILSLHAMDPLGVHLTYLG